MGFNTEKVVSLEENSGLKSSHWGSGYPQPNVAGLILVRVDTEVVGSAPSWGMNRMQLINVSLSHINKHILGRGLKKERKKRSHWVYKY